MIVRDDSKVCVRFGDDLHDVFNYLTTTPKSWNTNASTSNDASNSWDFRTGWAGALKLAESGWSEGAVNLADKLGALPPNEAEPEYTYDVAGYMPDVPLFCSGDPMHMRNDGHPDGRKPIVHLVINMWILCFITAQEQANFGTAMVAMIGQIEASGRQVELDVVFAGKQRTRNCVLGWKVKRAGDVTDLAAVAFAVAHPAAFRRIGFALIERLPKSEESWGYGHDAVMSGTYADLINAEGAHFINGVGHSGGQCKTMDGALRFAAKAINDAAGETLVEIRD